MNYKEIQDFVKAIAKSGVAEVEVETKDIKIFIKTSHKAKPNEVNPMQQFAYNPQMTAFPSAQQNVQQPITNDAVQVKIEEKEDTSKYLTIKASMVGTFYKKPSPDKPDFVNIGDNISKGQTICIIEAMKLFNEIESEISGKVVPLLLIR